MRFAAGFVTGAVVMIVGFIAVTFWWTSPVLDVGVEFLQRFGSGDAR